MHKILFLYAELNPYNIPVLKELVRNDFSIYIIHWDHKKLTPYIPPILEGVKYFKRSKYDGEKILSLIEQVKPSVICTSGWMDPVYNAVARQVRKSSKIPVIAMTDTQWRGGGSG
ncbi:hypothetical protein [Niabella digestorum]|jgi:hypothetical protein|uniref:Cobalamin B12-binding domain-containing protein n=1 Tax=Niabella digestorum TaxID=3117701 RepID=A0ABU7RFN4_9BACT